MSENQFQVPLERTANQPITEGIHILKIASGDEGEGAKGPYWQFTLTSTTPGEEGKTLRHFVSLTPQSRWRLELFLDAVGAPAKGAATIDKFIGRQIRAQVTHEIYEGRTQARIGEMWPVNAPANPGKVQAGAPVVIKSASVQPTVASDPATTAPAPIVVPVQNNGLPEDAVTGETPASF